MSPEQQAVNSQLPIDGKQIKLIHIAIAQLKIDDATYRYLLRDRFGAGSSKQLSYGRAHELIEYFKKLGFEIIPGRPAPRACRVCAPRPKRDSIPDNTVYLVSLQQLAKVQHLREDIRWKYHDGYERWLKKYFGLDKIKLSIEASAVIEALKNMVKSQNKCNCKWNLGTEDRQNV